jgi:hypothetical protein
VICENPNNSQELYRVLINFNIKLRKEPNQTFFGVGLYCLNLY